MAKRLMLRGFINYDFEKQYFADFIRDVSGWLKQARLRHREYISEGIENAPQAFMGILNGHNIGKTLVRMS